MNQAEHVPFEDAILFDMFLDLVSKNFEPHTRIVEDGPRIQLEILQALEKLQTEAEAAAGMTPSTFTQGLTWRLSIAD